MNYIKKVFNIYNISDLTTESIIVSILIILIDKYNLISLCLRNDLTFIIMLLTFCLIIRTINKSNLKKISLKGINELDKYIFESFFLILVLFCYILVFNYKFYKIIILSIISVLFLIVFIIRSLKNKKEEIKTKNILDLKEICDKKIDLKNYDEMVLIEEKDVEYDLLNRSALINQLYSVIVRSLPSRSFTIGLNGKWGSGKTTIVNNVLSKLKTNKEISNYLIVRFDPWMFNDERLMLEAFLKEIFKVTNYSISPLKKNEIIEDVVTSIFPASYKSMLKFILTEINEYKNKPDITKVVNNYLESNKKKLIIIIDNLDRIDGEKALFLIKCLDSVLNFENTINILLYDEDIINNVLKDKFNFSEKYMEKLVQLKIDIPIIDKHLIEDIKNIVSNNLVYGGQKILNFVGSEKYEFDNLRELKRYLNSIISLTIDTKNELNSKDYSILKYIQLKCPELYYEIWNNKRFFISYDVKYDRDIPYILYHEGENAEEEYFKNLYANEKYKDYLKYAEKVFPNMKNSRKPNYSKGYSMKDYSDSVLKNKASNARYFDLYFTDEENDFTRLRKEVLKIISLINANDNYYEELEKKMKEYSPDEIKVFMETIYLSIDEIYDGRHLDLLKSLVKILPYTKQRTLHIESDSREKLYVIIAELLSRITKEEFEEFKKILTFKHLSMIFGVKLFIDEIIDSDVTYDFNFTEYYEEMCSKVFKENINLYDKENYVKNNIWALSRFDEAKTRKYLKKIINKDNVYLLLCDLIITSVGNTGYGYFISDDNIKKLAPNINFKKLMTKENLTDKERFVKEIYEKSVKEDNKFKKVIRLDEYVEL